MALYTLIKYNEKERNSENLMSLCLPEKRERMCVRERRKAGSSWLGATRNYPLDSRPDTKAWLRLRISDLDQRETLCTQRSEACLRVFTCENKGERGL